MLRELSLFHFRNYTEQSFSLAPQTIITGPNGAGKTNILEAVALLSLTTSWKTERDSEVVQWDEPFCRVTGDDRELVVQRHPYYKRIRIDGMSKRVGEVVGTLPTVIFQPDDSALIYGAPTYRRQALDRLLSQTVPGYLKAITQLQKVLKQRNKLLKQIQEGEAQEIELAYWDEQLAVEAELIQNARAAVFPVLQQIVTEVAHELLQTEDVVRIEYQQSPKHGEASTNFLHHLQHNRYKELAAGTSLYGPHREDILFFWGEHQATEGMSRGQVRATTLAFKIAELRYLESHSETAPILLLDDIFSEFDALRRQRVTELTAKYQTILTCTDVEHVTIGSNAQVITLI